MKTKRRRTMKTETMTVHGALAELKMLDKRIEDKIDKAVFATANKNTNKKIAGKEIKDYVAGMNSTYQSITDLIKRRAAIRRVLSISNAVTKVKIADKEYSVAEAIEMKRSGIDVLTNLLSAMVMQKESSEVECERINEKLSDKADAQVSAIYGTKEKVITHEAMSMREAYIAANTMEVVSIDSLDAEIEKLRSEIDRFNCDVDVALSVSNATTTITFAY